MKEIKDGSKKESIKSIYSFHVRPTNSSWWLEACWEKCPFWKVGYTCPQLSDKCAILKQFGPKDPFQKKSSKEPDNFSNFAILGWIGSWSGWHSVQGEAQGGGRRGGIFNAVVFVFLYIWILYL